MDILFAENSKRQVTELKPETVKDLALMEIVESVADGENEIAIIRDIFTRVPVDIEDSRFRQEILKDFLENETLTQEITDALYQIKALKDYAGSKSVMKNLDYNNLYTLLESLRELAIYVNVSEEIVRCLKKSDIKSRGLIALRDQLDQVVSDEGFETAKKDINAMLEDLSNVRGAIVGVNFTPDLNVEQVSIVEYVPYRIKSKYKFAEIAASLYGIMNNARSTNAPGIASPPVEVRIVDPLLVTMTPQIEKHMKRHYGRMKSVMSKYLKLDASSVTEMYEALVFYIAMANFGRRLKAEGCDICLPVLKEPEGSESGSFVLRDLYNVRLFIAQEKNIITNDLSFTPNEKMYILTGPNRGGKTIIEQAVGIISVMAAIGSFVTASSCEGQPYRNVLTHFPIDENLTINYGRLGEEAVRIKEIVKEADERTLILFNETYSTTSAADGLYLSKDLLRILKERGTATIFNTHIHEVARSVEEMNQWEGESDFVSIIMEMRDNVTTFKVKRSDPESKSYARNIAEKYGITYEQMKNS